MSKTKTVEELTEIASELLGQLINKIDSPAEGQCVLALMNEAHNVTTIMDFLKEKHVNK